MDELIINDGLRQLAILHMVGDRVTKSVFTPRRYEMEYMSKLIPQWVDRCPWYVARVYGYSPLVSSYKEYPYAYQYTMERLLPISLLERDMVYVYTAMDDLLEGVRPRRFTEEKEDILLETLSYNLLLTRLLQTVGPIYHDLHEDQVMRDKDGNYKVVDLDTFIQIDPSGNPVFPPFDSIIEE